MNTDSVVAITMPPPPPCDEVAPDFSFSKDEYRQIAASRLRAIGRHLRVQPKLLVPHECRECLRDTYYTDLCGACIWKGGCNARL